MDVPDSKDKVWQLCLTEDIQVMEMVAIEWVNANWKSLAKKQGYNKLCHLIEDNSVLYVRYVRRFHIPNSVAVILLVCTFVSSVNHIY